MNKLKDANQVLSLISRGAGESTTSTPSENVSAVYNAIQMYQARRQQILTMQVTKAAQKETNGN